MFGAVLAAGGLLVILLFFVDQLYSSSSRRDLDEQRRFLDRTEAATAGGDAMPLAPDDPALPDLDELMDEIERQELTLEEKKAADLGRDLTYVTRLGDTVRDLAAKYLGEAGLARVIYERNPRLSQVTDPPPGTRIVIPLSERR